MQEIILTREEGFVVIRNAGENAVVSFTATDAKSIGLVRVLARQITQLFQKGYQGQHNRSN